MALRKELQPNIETAVRLYPQVLELLKAYIHSVHYQEMLITM